MGSSFLKAAGLARAEEEFRGHPLALLPRADLDLVVQLVLRSGSLKDLAAEYGVSYPTIRSRLDKLIERLAEAVQGRAPDPVRALLADLIERGEVTPGAARSLREAMDKQQQSTGGQGSNGGAR